MRGLAALPGLASFFLLSSAASVPRPDAYGKYTIKSAGIEASFIPYSAAVTNLYLHDKNGVVRDVVLGYDNASTYASDPIHLNYGAIPGRYANRIVNATYVLDGKRYYTERNNGGNSTMHSGVNGWSYRLWNVSDVQKDSITFTIRDESNSSMGMPGLVLGKVTYSLAPNEWRIKIEATAPERSTPLQLTNHAYWQLDAFGNTNDRTILNHTLRLPFGTRYIGYDNNSEPDGSLPNTNKYSINDFWSAPKKVGANSSAPGWVGNCGYGLAGYDCGWLIDRENSKTAGTGKDAWTRSPVASLWSDWSGIRWDMYSNQAGMAMTSCGFLDEKFGLPVKSTQGVPDNPDKGFVGESGCIAVEPQDWMSGITFPEWGRLDKQIWGPEKGTYVNEIVYKFSIQP